MAASDREVSRSPSSIRREDSERSKTRWNSATGRVRKAWRALPRLGFKVDDRIPGQTPPQKEPPGKPPTPAPPAPERKPKSNVTEAKASGSPGKDQFKLLTLGELENLPDPEWLIDDILPCGGLGELYGEPAAGKSFLALDWSLSIASGKSWLGHEVKGGPVVYVYAEGAPGLKNRVRAWRKVGDGEPESLHILPHALDVRDTDAGNGLIAAIRDQDLEPALIVIDTLARCFGDGDENSPKDMNAFIAGTDWLRKAFDGATVLVVHHSGKKKSKGGRGHSSLYGGTDAIMELTKSGNRLTLKCDKAKDAEEFADIKLRLTKIELGDGASSCVIAKGSAQPLPKNDDDDLTPSEIKALEVLRTLGPDGARYKKWLEACPMADSTFKEARTELVDSEKVTKSGKIYRVADPGPEAGKGPE